VPLWANINHKYIKNYLQTNNWTIVGSNNIVDNVVYGVVNKNAKNIVISVANWKNVCIFAMLLAGNIVIIK